MAFMASREPEACFWKFFEVRRVVMSEGALSMILQRSMYWRAEVARVEGVEEGVVEGVVVVVVVEVEGGVDWEE